MHIYIYTHTLKHTQTHTGCYEPDKKHIHTYMTYMHAYLYIYTHTQTHTNTHRVLRAGQKVDECGLHEGEVLALFELENIRVVEEEAPRKPVKYGWLLHKLVVPGSMAVGGAIVLAVQNRVFVVNAVAGLMGKRPHHKNPLMEMREILMGQKDAGGLFGHTHHHGKSGGGKGFMGFGDSSSHSHAYHHRSPAPTSVLGKHARRLKKRAFRALKKVLDSAGNLTEAVYGGTEAVLGRTHVILDKTAETTGNTLWHFLALTLLAQVSNVAVALGFPNWDKDKEEVPDELWRADWPFSELDTWSRNLRDKMNFKIDGQDTVPA
jgi:hypothetical protein